MQDGHFWQGGSTHALTLNYFAGQLIDVNSVDDFERRPKKYQRYEIESSRRSWGQALRGRAAIRRVFLSHAAADAPLAEYLSEVIRTSVGNVEVFVASSPGQVETGEEWLTRIKQELRDSDTYLVLLTPTSIERLWIWFETGAAWMSERRLVPVVARGLEKNKIPPPLGAHQALSLDDERDVRQLFRDLRLAVSDVKRFCAAVAALTDSTASARTYGPDLTPMDFK